ncbi:MAG: FAD-dependent oxidoreductase [Anaerolineae bacterium]|nr:FAD-dependent oxidoreductase [Anaerolineae bacterium]
MAEHKLGSAVDLLHEGEMRAFELDDQKMLLTRVDGQYYALGATCTHYGGPLAEGVLNGHIVMCPWHHACFDVRSGLRTEPPALDNVPHYEVQVREGEVVIKFPAETIDSSESQIADRTDDRVFVIVGGGAAGNMAAEELRQSGFQGEIVLLSAVSNVPIDRPNLSKEYLAGKAKPEWMPLRSKSWYDEHKIDLRLDTRVQSIDTEARAVKLKKGDPVGYDKLLLATGSTPRKLDVPGHDLEGIFELRTQDDADAIIAEAASGQRVIVIGSSFIGMEVAASLGSDERGLDVMVIGQETTPFEKTLGRRVGLIFQQTHEANGVQFRLGRQVARFIGKEGRVAGVELNSGETLYGDFVVVGIGVTPATDFLSNSGLKMDEKSGALLVDEHLQTSDPHIYAAGDIASYPAQGDGRERIEHWRVAEQQGMVAARHMLGLDESVQRHVPFFWTNQWDLHLRYVGHATHWDDVVFRGRPEDRNFIAFYLADGRLLAAAGCQRNRDMAALEFILRHGLELTPDQMRDEDFDLPEFVQSSTMPASAAQH